MSAWRRGIRLAYYDQRVLQFWSGNTTLAAELFYRRLRERYDVGLHTPSPLCRPRGEDIPLRLACYGHD